MSYYYTVKELSQRWGVVPSTVNGLLRKRELTGMRVGKAWRIPEEAVQEYEEAHTYRAGSRESVKKERTYITKIT
jgi:excisionase family DNA binding protein